MTPGTRLGPYEILDAIGAGGMGEVYKARDTRLDRVVAVKTSKEQFSERFDREARAVAALNHPNICTLFDVGPNYLVMEYIEGPTLAERIADGPIPLEEALPIARQIAEALEAAHEKGIVHRDLKPANIKLTLEGKVKVLDFGLAKAFDIDSAAADPRSSPTLTLSATRAGVILGTAGYMSPEQARGVPADKRADIWSYGVVLFEMLTGRHTFTGETVSDTLAAVLRADLDWAALPPDTPPAVHRLLRRCLQRDRKKRLPDIAVARLELDEPPEPAPLAQPPVRGLSRWWIAAAALPALALLALAAIHFREAPPAEAAIVRFQIPLPEKTRPMYFAISPDGRRLAFGAIGPDSRTLLWVRALDSLEARSFPGTDNSGYFFWSPDSRFIGYWADGKLKKVDASGGPPQTVCDAPGTTTGAWNRSGVIVFGTFSGGLFRVSAAGGTATKLTKLDPHQERSHVWPVFLPDGKHFLYLAVSNQPENSAIYLAELDSKLEVKSPKRLIGSQQGAAYLATDQNKGYLIFQRETTLMAQALDVGRGELSGEAFPVFEHVGAYLSYGLFSVSATGTMVYRTGGAAEGTQLVWFDREGKSLGTLGAPGLYGDLALSPDGKQVAASRSDFANGNQDIWLLDPARGAHMRFTFHSARENSPVWSPDGSRIAFASNREGPYNIYRKAASGAGNEEALLPAAGAKYPTDWSRDGRFLLYTANDPKTGFDLWVLPNPGDSPGGTAGSAGDRQPKPYLQTPFNEFQGQFSPDGHWVAYCSAESGRTEIYVQPFPASGSKWQISTGTGIQPRWRGDGKELFYLGPDGKLMAVEVKALARFEAGVPKALFATRMSNSPVYFRYTVAADGKRFLINSLGEEESAAAPFHVVLNWKGGRQ